MNLRRERKDDVEVNLTSLIDVVFLLLIFFMVSTTFQRESEIKIKLPEASAEQVEMKPDAIEVMIDDEDRVYVRGQRLVNTKLSTIRQALSETVRLSDEPSVVISADAHTTHQAVVRVMDAARQIGLVKITFATQKVEEDAE